MVASRSDTGALNRENNYQTTPDVIWLQVNETLLIRFIGSIPPPNILDKLQIMEVPSNSPKRVSC